ncbi:MAG: hypothetical protein M1826_001015 [Phylliscum demangeonii]|nr:MAG: hypothetical protein M1826_001015 [Phylliscum demangeonii]
MPPPPTKRRKVSASKIEVINFDFTAREDYLSGFHKRKVERAKHAQALAAKKARADRIEQRRRIRQERRDEAQKHVESMNAWLKQAEELDALRRGEEPPVADAEDDDGEEIEDEWNGFGEDKEEAVRREDEYIDEGLYTTVTVEAVDVSKEGLHAMTEADGDEDPALDGYSGGGHGEGKPVSGKETDGKPKPKRDRPVTKKRKKFKYENKAERKVTKTLQRVARAKKGKPKR